MDRPPSPDEFLQKLNGLVVTWHSRGYASLPLFPQGDATRLPGVTTGRILLHKLHRRFVRLDWLCHSAGSSPVEARAVWLRGCRGGGPSTTARGCWGLDRIPALRLAGPAQAERVNLGVQECEGVEQNVGPTVTRRHDSSTCLKRSEAAACLIASRLWLLSWSRNCPSLSVLSCHGDGRGLTPGFTAVPALSYKPRGPEFDSRCNQVLNLPTALKKN
jgi:hypothetical protein